MDACPLISIIIPTYNREKFISKTIESVLGQTYPNFEIIIVDDGSQDDTEAIVSPYLSERTLYVKKENGERGAARNYGLTFSKGDYVTFVDSDDIIYPNHFEEAVRLINEHRQPAFFHLGYEIKTPEGALVARFDNRSGDLGEQIVFGNSLSCIGIFAKREFMLDNLFNEDRRMAGSEDWELWVRMASRYPLLYSNKVTACMIDHENRSVVHFDEQKLAQRIDLAAKALLTDEPFLNRFGHLIDAMLAHLNLYIAIHMAISHKRGPASRYAWKALNLHPSIVFSKKFLVLTYRILKG